MLYGTAVGKAPRTGLLEPDVIDPDRVELAFSSPLPRAQETVQFREIGDAVQMLPKIALRQTGIIGQVIEYLRRCQAVILQFPRVVFHGAEPLFAVAPSLDGATGRPSPAFLQRLGVQSSKSVEGPDKTYPIARRHSGKLAEFPRGIFCQKGCQSVKDYLRKL